MKVAVTGGAGFIGSHLVAALLAEGHEVDIADTLVSKITYTTPARVRTFLADIRYREELTPVFRGADTVFHLAALPRVPFSFEQPALTSSVNIAGTHAVLEAAAAAGVRRVVYAGSSSAYGNQPALPLREDMPAGPLSPYAAQKWISELCCQAAVRDLGIQTVCLRYFNVYGPGMDPNGPYALVIGKFLQQRLRGEPMTICGDGNQSRDFTHVSDVVRATVAAMYSQHLGHGEVINIGAGRDVTVNRLAALIGGSVTRSDPRQGEPRRTLADNAKAQEFLGWTPRLSIEEGIADLKQRVGLP